MRVQVRELEGRDHLVVPVVLVVEGVLNGSQGAVFYPVDELRESVSKWLGRPIVVEHPGQGSATSPEVFNRQKIGTIFNVRMANDKLIGEAWIDIARAMHVDSNIVEAIRANRPIEVSTGLGITLDEQPGSFGGRDYHSIARNHQPDHLAILPNSPGACSIQDGCGLARNESANLELLMS